MTATPSAAASSRPAASPSASSTICSTAYLQTSVGRSGTAAGSSYYPIEMTNIAGTPCTLYGYPGVSLVTAVSGGTVIGAPAVRNPARPLRLVTLAPGATASALLQVGSAANYPPAKCKPVTAHWLRVYPPGQFTPLYYSFTAQACSADGKFGQMLNVSTVQPGTTGR